MKIFACSEVDFPKGHQPPSYGCLCPFPVNRVAFHIAAWALKSSNRCSGNRYWRSERTEPRPRCSDSGQQCCNFIASLPCQVLDVIEPEHCCSGWIRSNLPRPPPRGSCRRWDCAIDEREYPSHGLVMVPPPPPPPRALFPCKKPLNSQPVSSCNLSSVCPNYFWQTVWLTWHIEQVLFMPNSFHSSFKQWTFSVGALMERQTSEKKFPSVAKSYVKPCLLRALWLQETVTRVELGRWL